MIVAIGNEKDAKKIVLLIEKCVQPIYLEERTNYGYNYPDVSVTDDFKHKEIQLNKRCIQRRDTK